MLYAIVESGGKQYKAVEGSFMEVDLLPEGVGKKKTFDKVMLLVDDEKVDIGSPYLKSISVDTTIVDHFKGPKIIIFKYRAKERYRRKTGHRQQFTRVIVDSISFPGKVSKPVKKPEAEEKIVEVKKPKAKKSSAAAASKPTAKKPAKKSTAAAKKVTPKASASKKTVVKK